LKERDIAKNVIMILYRKKIMLINASTIPINQESPFAENVGGIFVRNA